MLSEQEADALARGQLFKRVIRAAAALNELYDDVSIGEAVGVGRGAVAGWWTGSRASPETIYRIADVTGLSADELHRFLYADGPPPTLPAGGSPVASGVQEGLRRDQQRPPSVGPDMPGPSPRPRTRGSGAARG